MAPPNPYVIVSDGREFGIRFPMGEPGEQAFRTGVALTNRYYESACLIADAFALACTPPYLGQAFKSLFPEGWRPLVDDLVKGLVDNLKWIVTGAGVGAVIGAGLGLLLPPAEPLTIAGGAALGSLIAQWALLAAGVVTMAKVAFQISNIALDLLAAGVTQALNRNREEAARLMARAIALIIGAVIPLAIVTALTKGAGKLMRAQSTRFMVNRLTTRIQASCITTAAQARAVGLLEAEWKAIAETTRSVFQIFLQSGPRRGDRALRRPVGRAFQTGLLQGLQIRQDGPDRRIHGGEGRVRKIHRRPLLAETGGRRLPHPGARGRSARPALSGEYEPQGGPWLDNHREPIAEGGKTFYILRHPDGKTFVPTLSGRKWLPNDDPREVAHWNRLISKAIEKFTGKPVDWRGYQHGKSADFQVPHKITGEVGAGWPSRNAAGVFEIENEAIVIGVGGNLYVTDWHGLAHLAKSLEVLNFRYPWAKAIIR
ncbi:MAG: hypothetical protein IPL88_12940 [Rhizobiales bacterium]|nr:hypothetical protein [Hyphomicrobiales bacterium]